MRNIAHLGLALLIFLLLIQGCGTSRSAAEKEQLAAEIADAVNASNFIFKATYVCLLSTSPSLRDSMISRMK